MNAIFNSLLDAKIINELILAVMIFIGSIIFAINEDKMDKNYEKTYIIVIYSLFFISFVFLDTEKLVIQNSLSVFKFIPVIFNIIFGINYSYISDDISKFLGRIKLMLYKTIEWFFITKTYIIYIFLFFIKLLNLIKITNVELHNYLNYSLLVIFFSYHLLSNMVDTFGIYGFRHMTDIFFNNRDINFKKNRNEISSDIVNILSFLVFVEDKDFFIRKGSIYNPIFIIKRKFKDRENMMSKNIEEKNRIFYISWKIKVCFINFKYLFKSILNVIKNIRTYIRGFSTIEQQLIRRSIMKPDTYEQYKFRRKIFVEWIANPMFFDSLRTRRSIIRNIKKDNIDYYEYKVEILTVYYNKILDKPKTIDELIKRLAKESRLGRNKLYNIYNNDFSNSKLKKVNNKIISNNIERRIKKNK